MTDITDTILMHYGKKGMKWGVRNTAQRMATRSTQRAVKQHQNALSGKGVVGKVALLDKYTWGRNGRFEGYHDKKIGQLERSKERIANGELAARTLLFGPVYSKK